MKFNTILFLAFHLIAICRGAEEKEDEKKAEPLATQTLTEKSITAESISVHDAREKILNKMKKDDPITYKAERSREWLEENWLTCPCSKRNDFDVELNKDDMKNQSRDTDLKLIARHVLLFLSIFLAMAALLTGAMNLGVLSKYHLTDGAARFGDDLAEAGRTIRWVETGGVMENGNEVGGIKDPNINGTGMEFANGAFSCGCGQSTGSDGKWSESPNMGSWATTVCAFILMFICCFALKTNKLQIEKPSDNNDWKDYPAYEKDSEKFAGNQKVCLVCEAKNCEQNTGRTTDALVCIALCGVIFTMMMFNGWIIQIHNKGEVDNSFSLFFGVFCTVFTSLLFFKFLLWAAYRQNYFLQKRLEIRSEQFYAVVGDQWESTSSSSESGSTEHSDSGEYEMDDCTTDSYDDDYRGGDSYDDSYDRGYDRRRLMFTSEEDFNNTMSGLRRRN